MEFQTILSAMYGKSCRRSSDGNLVKTFPKYIGGGGVEGWSLISSWLWMIMVLLVVVIIVSLSLSLCECVCVCFSLCMLPIVPPTVVNDVLMLLSLFLSARNLAASTLYEINQSINNDQSINRALCRRRLEKFARYTRPSNSHHYLNFCAGWPIERLQ